MLLHQLFQKILYKFFCAILSVVMTFSGGVVHPSAETPIDVKHPGKNQAVMALIADPQIGIYMYKRYITFKGAAEDLHNSACKFDAVVGLGDITENAQQSEFQLVYDGISGLDTRYIMATGNHDIRLHSYKYNVKTFSDFANTLNNNVDPIDALHFSERVNGYKVIVLGSDKTELERAYLSDEELEWLDDEVEAENGKPTFVICHQPLKDTHNEKNAFGSITNAGGHVGDQSITVKKILSKYKNVFFITGHLHSGFGPDSYNNLDGIHCINVPSMSIENKDGTYNNAGTGYILEVYKTKVIFRARDFAKGTWVAETTGDSSYDIEIKIQK